MRSRPLLLSGVLEKAGLERAAVALRLGGRIPAPVLPLGLIDLALAVLSLAVVILVAYLRTP